MPGDVFVDASDNETDSSREKPCAKPRCKKRRVSSSKDKSTSSESEKDGECTKSDREQEDGEVSGVEDTLEETVTVSKDVCITNSEQYFLREFRKMKADVEKMKTDNSSFGIRVKNNCERGSCRSERDMDERSCRVGAERVEVCE